MPRWRTIGNTHVALWNARKQWGKPHMYIEYQHDQPSPDGYDNVTHNYEQARQHFLKTDCDAFLAVEDDIIVPEVCPVLGIELNREVSQRGGQSDSPSIDRIDSSKGYVKGNIWVISLKANRNKGDFTLPQLENMVKLIKKHMANHQ